MNMMRNLLSELTMHLNGEKSPVGQLHPSGVRLDFLKSPALENETALKTLNILESMDTAVFILDRDRDFIELQQPLKSDVSIQPEMWVGKNILETGLPSNSLDLLKRALDKAESSGVPEYLEYSFKTGEEIRWHQASIEKIISEKGVFEGFIIRTKNITERKLSEKAIKASEERYKLLADNITDLLAIYSPDGVLEFISNSVYRLLGYQPSRLIGKDPSAFIHPDDLVWLNANFHPEEYHGDEYFSGQYRLLHAQGHWVHFSTRRKPIRDEHGRIKQIICNCRDITDKIKSQEALQKSEAHFRMLADNILDLVTLHDLKGIFEYVSPSARAVLGYEPEELIGVNAFELIHQDDSKILWAKNFEKAKEGCETFIDEFRMLHKNGNWIHLEATTKIIRDGNGNPEKFLTTSRDISEWKLAKSALQESEEKYRCLIESSDALIALMDTAGRYIYVNDIRAKFFGIKKEDVIGKTLYDFYEKKQADLFMDQFRIAVDRDIKVVYESPVLKSGQEYWLHATIQPIKNSSGEVCAAMVNSIDITAIKEASKKLLDQNRELRNIAFLQSHIVRSPLANLKALLDLVEMDGLNEENAKIYKMLEYSADQLDKVIKGIVEKTSAAEKDMQWEL